STQTVTITATSAADTTKSASSTITLNALGAAGPYSYVRTIVIAHASVANTDQTNFPFLFNTTDAMFKTIANGGHVSNANGYDIIFCSDAAGTVKLAHELQAYNPATGQVTAWVRIPTLSHTADTTLYVFYGNPGVSASQENKTGVWDSNFVAVWHLGKNTALSGLDSTSNANNSAAIGANTKAAAGLFGEAASLDGS